MPPPPSSSGRRLGPSSESGLGDTTAPSSSFGRSSATTFNPVSSAEPYFRTFNVTPSSVSQFVLAEASRGSPSPLLTHQSPVLNTEELYRAAGWMTPLPKDRSSSSNRDGAVGGGDSDDDEVMTEAAASSARLAVLSAKNNQHDTSQRMAHSLALSGSSSGGGGGAAAAATAAGVAAKEAEAAASAADAGMRTADRIRDEIAREPVLSLANLAGFGGEPGGAKADGGSDGEGGSSSSGDGVAGEEEEEEEPGIPKSIAEIYEVRALVRKVLEGSCVFLLGSQVRIKIILMSVRVCLYVYRRLADRPFEFVLPTSQA